MHRENLKKQRAREGRGKIKTWEKIQIELKRRFLPENDRLDTFLKFHNLKQKDLSVEEFTMEFEHLMLKCDVVEPEEQTIARYFGGLREEIGNAVRLQPYWTFNDVQKLALTIEKQQKEARRNNFRSATREGSSNRGSASSSKPTSTTKFSTSKVTSQNDKSTSSSKTHSQICFKCRGYGHIASECPNRKIVTLVEEEIKETYDEITERDESECEEEVVYADEGERLIIRRNLNVVRTEEDSWLR